LTHKTQNTEDLLERIWRWFCTAGESRAAHIGARGFCDCVWRASGW